MATIMSERDIDCPTHGRQAWAGDLWCTACSDFTPAGCGAPATCAHCGRAALPCCHACLVAAGEAAAEKADAEDQREHDLFHAAYGVPQRLEDLPVLIREALCVWEAYRTLGVSADRIVAAVLRDGAGERCLWVIAVLGGGAQFVTRIGPWGADGFETLWAVAAHLWNGAPFADHERLWRASEISTRLFELAQKLTASLDPRDAALLEEER
jgi:hypothetical protein